MSRYIDADALEKILAYWIEEKGYARKKHSEEFVEGMEDAYRRVLCFVKMEPKAEVVAKNATSDVRENVHAHWEGDGQCSNCKDYPLARYMRNPNFCPNCGAKMEVDDAEIH